MISTTEHAASSQLSSPPRFAHADATWQTCGDKGSVELLSKWGLSLSRHMLCTRFMFDRPLAPYYSAEMLVKQFLCDPTVLQHLKVITASDKWGSLGNVKEESIVLQKLETTFIDMTCFDQLYDAGIVREDRSIAKCFDRVVYCESDDTQCNSSTSVLVSDLLRECLVDNEADTYTLFSTQNRQELLFHIFRLLVLGGRTCQYEDDLQPYLDVSRQLYKDMTSASRGNGTKQISVNGQAFLVRSLESSLAPLFPLSHLQNVMMVIVDTMKQRVNVLYHASPAYDV